MLELLGTAETGRDDSPMGFAPAVSAVAAADAPQTTAGHFITVADVDGFRQGDRIITEKIFKGMWPRLYRAAYRILPDHDEAEEAAQHGFVKAYHARGDFRGVAGGAFAAWLLSIVRRCTLDILRAKGKRAALPEDLPAPGVSPAAQAERKETCAQVRAALAKLEPGDRAAIVMYELEELPQAEIADEMGITVNAFKVRLHRARRRLREALMRVLDGGTIATTGGDYHG